MTQTDYTPPPGGTSPPDGTEPAAKRSEHAVDRYDWLGIIDRAQIAATSAAVGRIMAKYGNRDGSSIRPGVALVSVQAKLKPKTVTAALADLVRRGLLDVVKQGGGGRASEYQLVQNPYKLDATRTVILSPTEYEDEIEAVRQSLKGKSRVARTPAAAIVQPAAGPETHSVKQPALTAPACGEPVDNMGTVAARAVDARETRDVSSVAFIAAGDGNAPPLTEPKHTNASRLTDPDRETHPLQGGANKYLGRPVETRPHQPVVVDLHTDLTVSRASPSQDPKIHLLPLPEKCGHGFPIATRPDGSSSCALCRWAGAVIHGPLGALGATG